MINNDNLIEFIRQAHEFAVQTLCSVPDDNPVYKRAAIWLKEVEDITTPDCVRKAFELDALYQKNLGRYPK